jgi:hypothetical protein
VRKGRTVKVGEKGGLSVEEEEGLMVGKKGMVIVYRQTHRAA